MSKAMTFVTVAMVCVSQTVWCAEQKRGLLEMLLRRSGVDPKSLGAETDGQAGRDAEIDSRALRIREAPTAHASQQHGRSQHPDGELGALRHG